MWRMGRMIRRSSFIFVLLVLGSRALAHPEGFSGLRVQVYPEKAHAVLTVHTRDLTAWFPPAKYSDYVADVSHELTREPGDLLEVQGDDAPVAPSNVRAMMPEVGMIEIDFDYVWASRPKAIQIWSKHLVHLPNGHQQLLFVEQGGQSIFEDTLTTDHDSVVVELPRETVSTAQARVPAKRVSFFLLGVQHIVTGYDHLLFLAALLLVCRNFREAASVITFFTVAHTITLSLAALDIVRMPARIVEPAIAASIVYVGLENLFGRHRFAWRALVTFCFGLVHGLGFAAALREVGLGSTSLGVAMPLLKFSIGLETGQLCIAAVLLRVLLSLREYPWYERRWVPACSVLVAGLGGYWLVSRVISG
jgi:hydrogenase/urease accessory protein HupE